MKYGFIYKMTNKEEVCFLILALLTTCFYVVVSYEETNLPLVLPRKDPSVAPETFSSIKKIVENSINIKKDCKNTHHMCSEWALVGECESNPDFMLEKCKESCRVCQSERCHDKDHELCQKVVQEKKCYEGNAKDDCSWSCSACDVKRGIEMCIRDPSHEPYLKPGNTNKLFENLIELNKDKVVVHSKQPWIITIDDVLTNVDCDKIIESVTKWSPSLAGDGRLPARTSSTYWCKDDCLKSSALLREFVEKSMQISDDYAEPLQVLKYNEGEFYKAHHDQNSPRSSAWGPRVFTVFFYLSDVGEGGETRFTKLNITVTPKKGRVLIWTNIKDYDHYEREEDTHHESLPVKIGVKYSANYWIHQFPFKKYRDSCGNSAYYENWY